ncbi:hypothetical protein [Serratia ureilytica]|uniref:MrpH family fimbial adhesin n=1 Tax=Serratia ureilytica TaxID=300181 RepID=UPI0018D7898A|nr:hypothetical protein [Serratia ureilytica]MBH3008168.1 hypothetical protein [Serratia ureilytica]MBH3022818.1 hypothetical protein [Serratia ureilytica]
MSRCNSFFGLFNAFLLFFLLPFNEANSALWPVVTKLETKVVGGVVQYRIISWDYFDLPAANGVAHSDGGIWLTHRHCSDTACSNPMAAPSYSVPVKTGDNLSAAAAKIKMNTLVKHTGPRVGECIGVVYSPIKGSPVPWSSLIFPPGSCVWAPPAKEWCEVITPSITLEHGILVVGTGRNDAVSNVTIDCTAQMKVKISFDKDIVLLSNGAKSKLTVPNSSNGWVNLKAGGNNAEVKSTIEINGDVDAGPFQGSSVVYLEYY